MKILLSLSLCSLSGVRSWSFLPPQNGAMSGQVMDSTSTSTAGISRRQAFTTTSATATVAASLFFGLPGPAWAASSKSAPTSAELERLQLGYKQVTYLLNNFDKETTVCRENGGECKRDAEPIRRALGLRSTTDPLFQIEKVFDKVKYMDIDPDRLEPFFEATEDWISTVNMSNSMAFISQFGEYNPGGGEDQVLKFLNESKTQVLLAQKALRTIMETLDLPIPE